MNRILQLSKEEAERIVHDANYKKEFIDKEVKILKRLRGNNKYILYCPHCGKEELEGYEDRPFFFLCHNCDKAMFMTEKSIFDDMNKELEQIYKKEKEEAVKKAINFIKIGNEVSK